MSEFAVGQKVRISDEALRCVLDSFPNGVGWVTQGLDGDGDYKVSSREGDAAGAGLYIRSIRLSAVEPEFIAFDDVLVGDKVRQTITVVGGDVNVKTITVRRVSTWDGTLVGATTNDNFIITKASTLKINSTLELLDRTAKEYKVGDKIGFADLKHLKTDTVLRNTEEGVVRIVDQETKTLVGRRNTPTFESLSRNVGYVILGLPEVK